MASCIPAVVSAHVSVAFVGIFLTLADGSPSAAMGEYRGPSEPMQPRKQEVEKMHYTPAKWHGGENLDTSKWAWLRCRSESCCA
jgi:hypothetical protein